MHLAIDLLNFANEHSFELPVHIPLFKGQDETTTIDSN